MLQTKIVSLALKGRLHQIDKFSTQAEYIQRNVLKHLIEKGEQTQWGTCHHYSSIHSYEDFAKQVSISDYDVLKPYIERMRHGESDVLWPGQVKWYAKSSGTTNDKSKFIPVTKDGLHRIHYQGLYSRP